MDLKSAPLFRVPGAEQIIADLALSMEMGRNFPGHMQVEDWRSEITDVRLSAPEVHTLALSIVLLKYAEEDELITDPSHCQRCFGKGIWFWRRDRRGLETCERTSVGARQSFCNCGAGRRAMGETPLTTVQALNPDAIRIEEQIPLFGSL